MSNQKPAVMTNYNYSGESGNTTIVNFTTNIFQGADSKNGRPDEYLEGIEGKLHQKLGRLEPIIRLLIAAISPARIYRINQKDFQQSDADSYTDLLIVMPASCNKPFVELEPVLDIVSLQNERLSCSLHNESNLIDALSQGQPFYTLHCRPENIICDKSDNQYPQMPVEQLEQFQIQLAEKYAALKKRAAGFYQAAIHLEQQQFYPLAAFMLHQAIELSFRGILKTLNGYDKKIHEIKHLKKFMRRCAPQLAALFPEETEEDKLLLTLLDKAYLEARYGEDYTILPEQLAALKEKARQVQETADAVFMDAMIPL